VDLRVGHVASTGIPLKAFAGNLPTEYPKYQASAVFFLPLNACPPTSSVRNFVSCPINARGNL
jgi:hypothetical protein